jgi:glycosidase
MQWTSDHLAGFSPSGTKETWLPLSDDYQEINVEEQLNKPGSMLSLYQDLIQIRKKHPVLQSGSYRSIPDAPKGCYMYLRENEHEKVLVCLNFTDQHCSIDPQWTTGGKVLLSSNINRTDQVSNQIILDPNEGLLILL